MVDTQTNVRDNSKMAVLLATLILTVAFHFLDPQKFLENLGYAVLAILSLSEARKIINIGTNTSHIAVNAPAPKSGFSCSRTEVCPNCKEENPEEAGYCIQFDPSFNSETIVHRMTVYTLYANME